MIFRSSMVGDLMGSAKSIDPNLITDEVKAIQKKKVNQRTDEESELLTSLLWDTLPDGAITILNKMISQKVLNWRDAPLDFFTLQKGIDCENESIDLYNECFDAFYIKNAERITKNTATGLIIDQDTGLVFDKSQPSLTLLTGECDLLDTSNSLVIDIKTAYSKATFPLILKMSKLYEWQLRAYMYLYDVSSAELAYCLVDTPEHLIKKNDPLEWHLMHDVALNHRVSILRIERDLKKEQQLLSRLALCDKYINEQLLIQENRK